jgi:ATP-dependent DNA ligase
MELDAALLYADRMRWSNSTAIRRAPGFIEPCLPSAATQAPTGPDWVYEIKQDDRVRIYTRPGADWTKRFPLVIEAVRKLKANSILLDGEGVIHRSEGLADFVLLHSKMNNEQVTLCAFDLLEHHGDDVRLRPLRERKDRLAKLLKKVRDAIEFNPHIEGDGPTVFAHACKLGCEGIVAKRLDLPYQSGRSKRWLKIKNPESPAARRADEGTF